MSREAAASEGMDEVKSRQYTALSTFPPLRPLRHAASNAAVSASQSLSPAIQTELSTGIQLPTEILSSALETISESHDDLANSQHAASKHSLAQHSHIKHFHTKRSQAFAKLLLLSGVLFVAGALSACDDPMLGGVREIYDLVGGDPRVDPSLTQVDIERSGGVVGTAAPLQVDAFLQQPVAKVDILWVIDDSHTMRHRQEELAENFRHFMAGLSEHVDTLDYQIGVVTTDTYVAANSGRLRQPKGFSKPWISSSNCVPGSCDPVEEFSKLARVGALGVGDEKGLLAAELALTGKLIAPGGHNHGFVRDDASLVIIIVSDEEDSSCAPIRQEYGGGCGYPPDYDHVEWGSTDYYVQLFRGLKGFGSEHLVRVYSVVATEPEVQFCETYRMADTIVGKTRHGCVPKSDEPPADENDPAPSLSCPPKDQNGQPVLAPAADPLRAIYSPRYVEVARGTGGQAISICSEDYAVVLKDLATGISGARLSFPLSRRPFEESIKVFVTSPDGSRVAAPQGEAWNYTGCHSGSFANVIRFESDHLPPPMSTVSIEYSVNVREPDCSVAP